ncbi:MAG: hypothetical protein PHQ35_07380 [Phycisphaerae bacterium]|nr:hypothetical protein [Phycisphaerae bacterium]MDD5380977.1 hypothetical protein [Phycisphaerae bacterium]
MKRRLIAFCVVTAVASVAYALPADNFDDNSMDTSLWYLYQDDPEYGWIEEINQRLEMRAATGASDGVAIYAANGWGLLPTSDFSFKIYFHFSATSGPIDADGNIALGLANGGYSRFRFGGLTRLEIQAGCSIEGDGAHPYFDYYNFITEESSKDRTTDDGTLYISYDAGEDELYFSDIGYWAADAWITVPDLLKGKWGGNVVFPYLSNSPAMAMDSGDAYFDNFVVDSGTFAPICDYALAGDWNNDCKLDFRDFAIMASNWLIDCSTDPGDPACAK